MRVRIYSLKPHASLLLLGTFSACYFLAMIVARKTLAPDDLYFWNALVTLVAMSFTFCFFGSEQLFLRFSGVSRTGQVRINRTTLCLMGAALVLFTVLLAALSEGYFFQLGSYAIYPVLELCVGLFVFVYNLLRVRKSFSTAQLAANGWKFTILIGVLFAPLGTAPLIIMVGLGAACVGAVWLFAKNRNALEINDDPMPEQWKTLFLGFLLSLFVLMLLNNADRLIITRYGSEALFSEYVYLVTLLLLPFSLLSNYFGFKEMAYLKRHYDQQAFVRKTLGVGALAAGLFLPWFALIYMAQGLLEVPVEVSYALPCLVIVTCRCAYALLSALFGLKASPSRMHITNVISLIAVLLAAIIVIESEVTIISMLYLLCAFWVSRSFIVLWAIWKIEGY
ncbi:hypothetical protein SAMN05444279_10582 [Ruegeria intermedia]|uniref:Membrane protein involved in the export of O-antigen and teichoic acid n=2 Tax=Ruegeria intermedia TaxID=996115 RepID=A0A1M4V0W0_9RHOB|nr:hypothetical protein SAMN05444279_10582 [Ruegeria intermedia]